MKFAIDAQLPAALTSCFVSRRHDAEYDTYIGMGAASDFIIAQYARAQITIIVTNDEDFLLFRNPDQFALTWLRRGNARTRSLLIWLEMRWLEVERLLAAGERVIELR